MPPKSKPRNIASPSTSGAAFFARQGFILLGLVLTGCARHSSPPYLVYVTNESSGDLTVIDPRLSEPLETIPLGKRPRGIHPYKDMLLVALSGSPLAPPGVDESTLPPPDRSADGIGVVDLKQKKVVRKLFGGSDPEEFAISKDGKWLYVANEDAAGLSVVDFASGAVVKTVPVGEEPEGVSLTPDGRFVYVTSEDAGTVTVVDTTSASVLKTMKVGRRPRTVVFLPDGSRAFVANENDASLSVIDAVNHQPLRTIPLGSPELKPMGQAITRNGARLYVSTGRGRKVAVVDTASETVLSTFEVGQRPWGLALSPDEKLLFTANGPSNDVSVIDVATQKVLRKVRAGDRPWGVAVMPK
jgi:PQQ-dependent catabolism-associated beta-propeller protein